MKKIALASLLFFGLGIQMLHAQVVPELRGGTGAYFLFADPSDITIEVKVWGAVNSPGLYEIRQGVHLSTLFSLAGGPQNSMQDERTRRIFTLRLYRSQGEGEPTLFLERQVENDILLLDNDPVLMHGDLLVLDEQVKQKFNWRDGVSIVAAVGTVVLVVDRIIRIANGN